MEAVAKYEAEVSLKVIRCGCGTPESHLNATCPKPRSDTNLGVVDLHSHNPLKQAAWRLVGKPLADKRIHQVNSGV